MNVEEGKILVYDKSLKYIYDTYTNSKNTDPNAQRIYIKSVYDLYNDYNNKDEEAEKWSDKSKLQKHIEVENTKAINKTYTLKELTETFNTALKRLNANYENPKNPSRLIMTSTKPGLDDYMTELSVLIRGYEDVIDNKMFYELIESAWNEGVKLRHQQYTDDRPNPKLSKFSLKLPPVIPGATQQQLVSLNNNLPPVPPVSQKKILPPLAPVSQKKEFPSLTSGSNMKDTGGKRRRSSRKSRKSRKRAGKKGCKKTRKH